MLGNLFDDNADCGVDIDSTKTVKLGIDAPPRPRLQCGLCGINNQGATCYLNSLLQTLLYTPEFKESLFLLGEEELGRLQDAEKPNAKVRVIPIQLQRLFARLLLSNQQSVSTVELTESFGWTNNEELQQHDVQELNRILFCAIEDSLVGTSGKEFIKKLYHGTVVNQIRCTECGKVSEREEDFLDITLTVAGNTGLEDALRSSFIEVERMDGKNQYKCGRCNKLVDATKGAKIRHLPSILSFSLLRFSFDFQKMERYKEAGKFVFPHVIDMSPHFENSEGSADTEYELFSVVIHGGGAYGGHYHAYIRDIDGLGTWVSPTKTEDICVLACRDKCQESYCHDLGINIFYRHPFKLLLEEEEILIPMDPSTGEIDFIECESPIEMIQYMLARQKDKGMTVDKLCSEMVKQTGVSWNKRFRRQYGPINKFFQKYDDQFLFDPKSNYVSLKDYSKLPGGASGKTKAKQSSLPSSTSNSDNLKDDNSTESVKSNSGRNKNETPKFKPKNPSPLPPEAGQCWFNFNDSGVHPIHAKEIEKQFSGKESAYMIFYRKRSLVRPQEAKGDKTYCIPSQLIQDINEENEELAVKREEYEVLVNKISLQIHFGVNYQYVDGALKPLSTKQPWSELTIDRRKSVTHLLEAISEFGSELAPAGFKVHRLKDVAAGAHLYDQIQELDPKAVQLHHLQISDGTKLFVWNGQTVQNVNVPTGLECEPLYLTVIYGHSSSLSRGFPKYLTLVEFRALICDILHVNVTDIKLKRLVGKDAELKSIEFTAEQEVMNLEELKFKDGDQLVAENIGSGSSLSDETLSKKSQFLVRVENRCAEGYNQISKLEVEREMNVGELKVLAMSAFGLTSINGGGRLRIDHESVGLRPPLHEELNIFEAGVSMGTCLVLEPGPAPLSDQITLTFTPGDPRGSDPDLEVMVNKRMKVSEVLNIILQRAQIAGGDWHLRKTNWCGEAAELLDDLDLSLDASLVSDGDHLLLAEGRIPPKGFLRIPVWLCPTLEKLHQYTVSRSPSIMGWIRSGIQNLMARGSGESTLGNSEQPVQLGVVEVAKETTLEDLKLQVMTLPQAQELPIPSPEFMRLRQLENGRMSTVLRGETTSLQRLKVTSCSILALQICPEEENLNQNQIVLNIAVRIPQTRQYESEREIIWDVSQGAIVQSLKQVISDGMLIPLERLAIAKHFPQRFEWMVLEDSQKVVGNQKGKKKGNKQVKVQNVKQAPYSIKDGDTIGVKDLQDDPFNMDDFTTTEDDEGKENLQREAENKRKEREERKKREQEFGEIPRSKRQEVGITIKVGDFT